MFSKTIFYYRKSELSWFRIVHFCLLSSFSELKSLQVRSYCYKKCFWMRIHLLCLRESDPGKNTKTKKIRKYQRFILKGPVQFPSSWWPDDGYWWINIKEFFGNNKLLLWALGTSCGGLSISVLRWRIFFRI